MPESRRQEGPNVLARATLRRVPAGEIHGPYDRWEERWQVEIVLEGAAGHEALTALRQGVVLGTTELSLAGRTMRAVVVPVERKA